MKAMVLLWWFALLLTGIDAIRGANVTYDGRSLIIDGQRKIIFSGSIHYPRSTPEMWPSLISKAKEGGVDAIQTYVFWNLHEPQLGQYNFSGRRDIVGFIKQIQAQGLYACVRIGPYIESEWSYGGLPFWLHDIPGIVYRSNNEPFKFHMQRFVTQIVNMLKSEQLFASQGGPIILSQIENEYQNVEPMFSDGHRYVIWAAEMAVGLQTGVPWVMCKQIDAPDPVINTCNGMKCGETFVGPNSPNKPSMWTENWTSFIQTYGEETPIRPAEDIAFQVALFIAKNGSYVNYYMYHGGTNFGRTASAYVITGYYDQAPLDEYGLIRQPKWGHLKELHAAIKQCSETLLQGEQIILSLGELQQAYVFQENSGKCAAFLVNNDTRNDVQVVFQNFTYGLPPRSISILPDCKTVAFNTAQVGTQYNTRSMEQSQKFNALENWEEYKEAIPNFDETSLRANTLLEQMNTTKDASDYLWYTFRVQGDSSNAQSILHVNSVGHVLHAFVNGVFVGFAHGHDPKNTSFSLQSTVSLNEGMNNVSLLSVMVGLPDSGAFLERRFAGLRRVRIQGTNGVKDNTNYPWGYQVGLLGENLQIYTDDGSSKVQWSGFSSTHQPLTWYKTTFDAPVGTDPLALNFASMGKGEAWVNGQSIGRYWVSFRTPKGNPSQTWYNVPRSFLKPEGNLLVLLEEDNGWPPEISIDIVSITQVCGHVSDSQLFQAISWARQNQSDEKYKKYLGRRPRVQLHCPPKKNITKILFASFGTPSGNCESYAVGSCHSSNSRAIAEKACLGKGSCSIPQSNQNFGGDPCPGVPKALLVDAQCT